jgi:transforming growth factor-beta-induced protein
LVLALLIVACAPAVTPAPEPAPVEDPGVVEEPEPEPQSIVDLAVADGRFNTLVAAVQAADLAEALSGPGRFTVFAPTDDAFAQLPEGTVEALLEDIPALTEILLYHVVEGRLGAEDVVLLEEIETLQGETITIRVEDGKVFINDAEVIITDLYTDNGKIHVVDSVLLP